jgi:hypothetical protein
MSESLAVVIGFMMQKCLSFTVFKSNDEKWFIKAAYKLVSAAMYD